MESRHAAHCETGRVSPLEVVAWRGVELVHSVGRRVLCWLARWQEQGV